MAPCLKTDVYGNVSAELSILHRQVEKSGVLCDKIGIHLIPPLTLKKSWNIQTAVVVRYHAAQVPGIYEQMC